MPNATATASATLQDDRPMLVVDDDVTVRMLHQAILERHGYRVVTAANGADALSTIEDNDISLVLLDSRMPGLSGPDVMAELRGRGVGVPIVMVTANDGRTDRIAGLAGGADDYVTKPVDPSELGARVVALLRGRQAAVDAALGTVENEQLRGRILEIIADECFEPVYQPIVDLADRSVVAYEALTRFEDRERPDLRFAEAAVVGLGSELEIATLTVALRSSPALPRHAALHVNVSPSLLAHPALAGLLATADRRVVVELTEHDRIDDYDEVAVGLERLGGDVRLAIDDAGAGFASMSHILALNPDEVKLDRLWVQGVDHDVAKSALVAGMVSFAETTETALIAEGVETEAEAERLVGLGVRYAQGFHLGRPAPVA